MFRKTKPHKRGPRHLLERPCSHGAPTGPGKPYPVEGSRQGVRGGVGSPFLSRQPSTQSHKARRGSPPPPRLVAENLWSRPYLHPRYSSLLRPPCALLTPALPWGLPESVPHPREPVRSVNLPPPSRPVSALGFSSAGPFAPSHPVPLPCGADLKLRVPVPSSPRSWAPGAAWPLLAPRTSLRGKPSGLSPLELRAGISADDTPGEQVTQETPQISLHGGRGVFHAVRRRHVRAAFAVWPTRRRQGSVCVLALL